MLVCKVMINWMFLGVLNVFLYHSNFIPINSHVFLTQCHKTSLKHPPPPPPPKQHTHTHTNTHPTHTHKQQTKNGFKVHYTLITFTLAFALSEFCGVSALSPNDISQYLTTHNQARAAVGVRPFKRSPMLASHAENLVRQSKRNKKCQMFSTNETNFKSSFLSQATDRHWPNPYGSNQAYNVLNAKEAVDLWVSEGKYYNYAKNLCMKGRPCGVYTQVVWHKSQELGCALASCGTPLPTIAICLYNPPGNYLGQKPY
ncbi:hypothetical protein LUZ60_004703 [Juncus effusus]|nr:hypothetical protein LUZ60_004703 [Juncus effusus]